MLTGFAEDDVLVAAIEAGCSGYVTKHNAVDEVVSAVRAAAAGEALISPSMLARLLPKLRRGYQGLGSDITPRELEVLRMLAEGLSNRAIADKMSISLHTVRNYVQSLLTKLQAHSKLEAVAAAVKEGIIRYP
jgi:DNA-binding NarL/FixJ family response regulator